MLHYEQAIAIRPDLAEAHGNLGNALFALNRPNEAVRRYEAALAINPEQAQLHHALGMSLQVLGRLEEAGQAFERAVALAPGKADFYLALAHSRPFTAQDPRLAPMEKLAQDLASLSEEERIAVHFALGKAYADLELYQHSFSHLRAGNALTRRRVSYDEISTLGAFDRIRETFSPALMRAKSGEGNPSPVPIFVVGMPRSGTTLIERILASHSQVFGAGEREELSDALPGLKAAHSAAVFPEVVSVLSGQALHEFGSRYLERLLLLPRRPNASLTRCRRISGYSASFIWRCPGLASFTRAAIRSTPAFPASHSCSWAVSPTLTSSASWGAIAAPICS
jgi:tetratricopeptide (TPR) repeat protein